RMSPRPSCSWPRPRIDQSPARSSCSTRGCSPAEVGAKPCECPRRWNAPPPISRLYGPVLPRKTRDTSKLRDVRGGERRAGPERLGGDQQVIRADRCPAHFQRGAQIARHRRVLFLERQHADIAREEDAQALSVLLPAPTARDAIPEFE